MRLLGADACADFAIRQYLPPYALTDYLLAAMETVVSGAMAEKLFVAMSVVVFCTGVRALGRAIYPGAGLRLWLLVIPFSFHFLLFAGSYNFSLGVGLVAWTGAFWLNSEGVLSGRRLSGFVVLTVALYLVHPFSLAVGLAFCGMHLALQMVRAFATGEGGVRRRVAAVLKVYRRHIFGMFVGGLLSWRVTSFIWPGEGLSSAIDWEKIEVAARELWRMDAFMPHVMQTGWIVRLCLFGLAVALAMTSLFSSAEGVRRWDKQFVFFFAMLLLVLPAWLPKGLTTAILVHERITVFAVVFLFAAACIRLPPRTGAALAVAIFSLGCLALRYDVLMHRPVVRMSRILVEAPALKPGARGAIVLEGGVDEGRPAWSQVLAMHMVRVPLFPEIASDTVERTLALRALLDSQDSRVARVLGPGGAADGGIPG